MKGGLRTGWQGKLEAEQTWSSMTSPGRCLSCFFCTDRLCVHLSTMLESDSTSGCTRKACTRASKLALRTSSDSDTDGAGGRRHLGGNGGCRGCSAELQPLWTSAARLSLHP